MAKKKSDQLFQLIKSLTKTEKRYFKLFVSRLKSAEDSKFLKLFDLIDKQRDYNEGEILKKESLIKPGQLSNLKAHLYKQILQSLRQYHSGNDIDLRIRELMDYSTILYNRCLYDLSVKVLDKAKSLAIENDKSFALHQILEIEKLLVTRFIKTNIEGRASKIISEVEELQEKLSNIATFSNLTLKLYSFYLKIGFIRNHKDFELVNSFLYSTLPVFKEEQLSFDEKMHLYNSLVGYYFFIQDYARGYEYAKKWVGLFDDVPVYKLPKIEMYIKGLNNLLVAQSKLKKYDEFIEIGKRFDELGSLPDNTLTLNVRLQMFKYNATHQINRYFMLGQFTEGKLLVPEIDAKLKIFESKLDTHYILIFWYKFVCMYFGASEFQKAVLWCNKILGMREVDIRSDIYGFTRILVLICHYELGNVDLIDYYIRSTYRYFIKKNNLREFYKIIMKFLRRLGMISTGQLVKEFELLKQQLLPLAEDPYEKISFIYFDIISWLESKITNRKVEDIIREKAMARSGGG